MFTLRRVRFPAVPKRNVVGNHPERASEKAEHGADGFNARSFYFLERGKNVYADLYISQNTIDKKIRI